MAAQVFWNVFYSSQRPSQIGPTADFYHAAIPPPIFSMFDMMEQNFKARTVIFSHLLLAHQGYLWKGIGKWVARQSPNIH